MTNTPTPAPQTNYPGLRAGLLTVAIALAILPVLFFASVLFVSPATGGLLIFCAYAALPLTVLGLILGILGLKHLTGGWRVFALCMTVLAALLIIPAAILLGYATLLLSYYPA